MAVNDSGRGGMAGGTERDPGLDRVYRAGAGEEPPARLDAAILAAARREVGARPAPLSSGLRRWRVPVSLAAVLVLSVSVVTLMREEGGDKLASMAPETASPSPAAEVAPQPAAPAPGREAEQSRVRSTVTAKAAPEAPRASPHEDVATGLASDASKAVGNSAGAPAAAGPSVAPAPEPVARPRAEPFRDSAVLAERSAPTPPAAGASQDVAASKPMAAERRAAAPSAQEAPQAAARMQARKESAPGEGTPIWRDYEKEPPQKWLERIEELKRQQRTADAETMLTEFKRRFPGYPLPAGW